MRKTIRKLTCAIVIATLLVAGLPLETFAQSISSSQVEGVINWANEKMNSGTKEYNYWCLKFVANAFSQAGAGASSYAYATLGGDALVKHTDENPPRGAVVFYDWTGTIDGVNKNWGHVGISLGNGKVIHADYNGIKITGLYIDNTRKYRGWGTWGNYDLEVVWEQPVQPAQPVSQSGSDYLADGTYTIESKQGGNLNIYAGIDKDGTNACIWEKDGSKEQKFRAVGIGGGKYRFYVLSSSDGYGRVLDVNRGTSSSAPLKYGLNIDIWSANDAPAQEWYIKSLGNGFYKIELAAVADGVLESAGSGNNSNVSLQRYSGSDAQQWKFTDINAPKITVPVSPTLSMNQTQLTEGEATFVSWNAVENSEGYWVAISKEPYGSANIVKNSGKITDTAYSISDLAPGKYRVNMQAENQAGLSELSNTIYFEVKEKVAVIAVPPAAPTISMNKTQLTEGEATFVSWNAVDNSEGYWVAVSKEPYGSTNIVKNSGKITDTAYSISDLAPGKYRVNMQAENQAGLSELSNTIYFEVKKKVVVIDVPPVAPTISMNKLQLTKGEAVSFSWNAVENVEGYWVAVSKEPYGSANIVKNSGKITDTAYSISDLAPGKYRVNMQAENQAGLSKLSNTINFEILDNVSRIGYVVNTDNSVLRVRNSSTLNAEIIGTLPAGQQILVFGEPINNFYHVQGNGLDGWSSADYIGFNKPVESIINDSANVSVDIIRSAAPDINDVHYYSNQNIYWGGTYSPPKVKGNCVWYAWGRAWEITGNRLPNGPFNHNAHTWWDGNIKSNKFKYGSTPKVGAIAVWNEKYYGAGHVAIVEKIQNGKVYISESLYIEGKNGEDKSILFRYREIYSTNYLDGYIYINEPNY